MRDEFGLWTGRNTNARDICWKQARNLKDDRRGSVGDDEITQILQGGESCWKLGKKKERGMMYGECGCMKDA